MMWTAALLTSLYAVTALSSLSQEGFPTLEAPSKLRVGHDSDTSVTVCWFFAEPEGVPMRNLEFVLTLEAEGQLPRKFFRRSVTRPFEYTLTHLSPSTKYNLKIYATLPNWRDSAVSEIAFVTLESDWQSPTIIDVSQLKRDDHVECIVRWKLVPETESTDHFEIQFCSQKCDEIWRERTDSEGRIRVPYDSSVNIKVIAFFNLPGMKQIKRSSEFHVVETGPAGLEEFFKYIHVEQVGNRVRLDWHRPFPADGPVSYYEVFACDANSRRSVHGGNVTFGRKYTARAPSLTGTAYEMSIKRGKHDAEVVRVADEDTSSGPSQCPSLPPLTLIVMKRLPEAVRFRIVFPRADAKTDKNFFEIDTAAKLRYLNLGPYVAEAFGLSPYQDIHLKIRSCLTRKNTKVDACGNFSDFKMLSNVAGPSPVQYLELSQPHFTRIVITWREPEEPRGPIDGYKIIIWTRIDGKYRIYKETLPHHARRHEIGAYDDRTSYEISVAAFNVDLEDTSHEHIGEWSRVATRAPVPAFVVNSAMIFSAALIAAAAYVYGCFCCVRRFVNAGRRRD